VSAKDPDLDTIFNTSISGEGGVIKSLCRYVLRYDLHKGMAEVIQHRKQIADLRETLGGVEQQVHDLRNAPGVRNSISDLDAAGWPGLVQERDSLRQENEGLRARLAQIETLCSVVPFS
jgi:hypothetical protein